MSADNKLDQLVKGAPPPNVSPTQVAESARRGSASSRTSHHSITAPQPPPASSSITGTTTAAVDALPSSPPQIYLNLLILESSLRLQYLSLRARLRLHVLLVIALTAWITTFSYLLFFRPREDGSGVGGSIYWMLESIEKLGWCGGVVTLGLFWGTGMYERGVRWPRRFVGVTNRGLRSFNMKVVVVRGSVLSEIMSYLGLLDPLGWFREKRVHFQIVPKDIEAGHPAPTTTTSEKRPDPWNAHATRHGLIEEDIAPSGDVLRLLLLPKPFSPDFREGWDTYRLEYWERENARRADLRKIIKSRSREIARQEGGWLWWTGWRGWKNVRILSTGKSRRQVELEKIGVRERPSSERLKAKRRLMDGREGLRSESHSRSSSRSSTPGPVGDVGEARHHRRGSSSHSVGSARRKKTVVGTGSRLSCTETVLSESGEEAPGPGTKRASGGEVRVRRESRGASASVPMFADEIKQEPAEA
ncbi:SPO7 protein [Teratosphaeria destructans]|uniref:SPO7 protein n=1 Tax=Teratosphaeria destructans TaxID=418781 RepID=A0A9W7SIY0_9PEZI|nr:SPO7 protein [Teratosphaeria destructans]